MKSKQILCALILCISAASTASNGNETWEMRLFKDDIRIYSRSRPDSPIDELKGECVLDAALEVVAQVMLDVPSYPQWVADCVDARKFNCTDSTTCMLYMTLGLPWPVRDRDVVLQSSTDMKLATGRIIGTVRALSDEIVPKHKKRVRITSMRGTWIFERISPKETMVTFILWADPAGYIPSFIVNAVSIDIPYRTLKGLQSMVKKEEYFKTAEHFKL